MSIALASTTLRAALLSPETSSPRQQLLCRAQHPSRHLKDFYRPEPRKASQSSLALGGISQVTWPAIDFTPRRGGVRTERGPFRRFDDRRMHSQGRHAERRGQVLGPAVVADIERRRAQHVGQVPQAGLADHRQHALGPCHFFEHRGRDLRLLSDADDHNLRAGFADQQVD